MDENGFIARLVKTLQTQLPGVQAHHRVMSYIRMTPDEALATGKNPRQSAVLILLFPENDGWHFVLTRRKKYEGVHSNQISLPGGKFEVNDVDLQRTALRETQEEIGVNASSIAVIGKLTPLYIPPSNFIVHPYVGYVDVKPDFIEEEKEVEEIVLEQVSRLLEEDVVKKTKVKVGQNLTMQVPYFDLKGHVVWGATAMVLSEFREIIE